MAEPTPGAPGGGGSGTSSATAATFIVNDASLRELRRTWQGLTQDVKNFDKAIQDLKRREGDLRRLGALTGSVGSPGGGGGTGTGSGRNPDMPPAPPASVPSGAGNGGGNGNGTPTPAGGGSAGGGGGGMSWRSVVKYGGGAAAAVVGASSAYFSPRMGGLSDNDLQSNYLGRATGGGYSGAERLREQMAATGIGGAQSLEDRQAGIQTLTRATGGTLTTGRGGGVQRQAGELTALNPDLGLGGSAQAAASLYTGTSSNRLRGATGQGSLGRGGAMQNPTQVYDRVLQTVFRGQPFTAQMITEGMVPGSPLQRSLDYLLPDQNAQEQFRQYAITRANVTPKGGTTAAGGNAAQATRAISAAAKLNAGQNVSSEDRALVKQAGLRDNIRSSQNRSSAQSVENATELGEAARGGIMAGFETLADTTENLTQSFIDLNDKLGGLPLNGAGFAAAAGSPIMNGLAAAGGVGGALFAGSQIKDLLAGRRRRRNGAGGGGDGDGDGGGGGLGGGEQRVFVTNWPDCICDGGSGGGDDDDPDVGRRRGGRPRPGRGRGGRLGRAGRGLGRGAAAAGRFAASGAGLAAGAIALGAAAGGSAIVAGLREGEQDELNDGMKARGSEQAGDGGRGFDTWKSLTAHQMFGKIPGLGDAIDRGTGYKYDRLAADHIQSKHGEPKRDCPLCEKGIPNGQKSLSNSSTSTPGAPPPAPFFSAEDTSGGVPRMRKGGRVAGNHTQDSVPILATPGEVVVPLEVVSRFGGAQALMKKLGFSGTVLGGQGDGSRFAKGGEVTGDTEGMHPEFMRRLKAWSASVGTSYNVGSGYRNIKEQERLYDRWIRRVPGQAKAAKPGSSNHNFGLASDGPHWGGKNPGAFGLVYPMSFEPWHVEPVGAKSMRSGAVNPMDLAGASTTDPANGVGASPQMAPVAIAAANNGGSFASESEALGAVLQGAAAKLGAAVAGISSERGAAAPAAPVSAGSDTAAAAPANPGGAAALGQAKAAARGWTDNEWDSLYKLWMKESGWKADAVNPTSSARGIPQMMMSAHYGKGWKTSPEAKTYLGDAGTQIDVGLKYIAGRYGTPSKAWAHSQRKNWYQKGAWDVVQDETAQLHAGEMVVPKKAAGKLRSMIAQSRTAAGSMDAPMASSGGVSRSVTLSITAPVTVVGKATQQDARGFLEMVKAEAERGSTLDMIGAGA